MKIYFVFIFTLFMNTTHAQLKSFGTLIELENKLRLHISAIGIGPKTIVFMPGFGSPSTYTDFIQLANEFSSSHKIALIDPLGVGFSEESKVPFKIEQTASQVYEVLQRVDEKPPFILVAHSFGALNALHFASKYQNHVEGIVLIDGVSPQTYQNFSPEKPLKFLKMINRNRWIFRLALDLGFVDEWNKRKKLLPKELVKIDKKLLKKNFANRNMIETAKQVKGFAEIVKNETNIKNIPLLVISARQSFTEFGFNYTNWEADQRYLTTLSKFSKQVIINGSHSTIHLSEKAKIVKLMKGFFIEFAL